MKKSRFPFLLSACVLALLASASSLSGQVYDVLQIVASDRNRSAGVEGPYRFDVAPLTPAPKGYVPFYISHYGRHGSRYAWSTSTYTKVKDVLDAADAAGALTPRGEKLRKDFLAFYEVPLLNMGDLTDLGREQHKEIARTMCEQFPEVFKDGGAVLARSSTSQRAIVSMNSFTVSLQKCAPKVDIVMDALHTSLLYTNPTSAPRDIAEYYKGEIIVPESTTAFRNRMTDYDAILDNLFTDRGFLEEMGGRFDFVYQLYTLWCGYRYYSSSDFMEDVFTPEQLVAEWESENYLQYIGHTRNRYRMIPILRDIITCADEAIATGNYKGHFRFGHDTVFNALCPLLNINGGGFEPSKAEDVKYWFQNYNTPKGANIQFVLYRSKKNPEILFKLLRNGEEVSLPQIQAVDGPYYRWDDFKAWAESVFKAHPRVQRPEGGRP
jgi:hypothetical protein